MTSPSTEAQPGTDGSFEARGRSSDAPASGHGVPVRGRDWVIPELMSEFIWVDAVAGWMGRYPVTNGEYRRFDFRHCSGEWKGHGLDGDRQPVAFVTYDAVVSYAEWLTQRERESGRLDAGLSFSLPTGDEWTCVAECGDGRLYPWGNTWPPTSGNYADESARSLGWSVIRDYDDGFPVSCAVEKSGCNPWGIHGLGGNVWEWTTEGEGSSRVVRGASWLSQHPDVMSCRYRRFVEPHRDDHALGLRLLLTPAR